MESLQLYIGIIAGVFSVTAYPAYVVDILKGNTKPDRVTWWILCLVNVLITLTYYASGARDTIWIPVSYSIGFFFIALLSIKYGEGGWNTLDFLCLLGAFLGVVVWVVSGNPTITLFLIIIIDFVGFFPTVYKTCKRPWTEDKTAWVLASIAAVLNLLAVEAWTLQIAAYPVYLAITNVLMVYFIYHRPPVCT